jgi:hypothetical protein
LEVNGLVAVIRGERVGMIRFRKRNPVIEYFNKTSRKLSRALWLSTGIFSATLIVVMLLLILTKPDFENVDTWWEFFLYIFLLSFGLSIFIVALTFFSGYFEYQRKESAFNNTPFTHLSAIGFTKIKILDKTLWVLLEEVFAGKFNSYWVVIDIPSKKYMGYNFMCKNSSNINLGKVQIPFRDAGIAYADTGFVITIPLDSYWTPSIYELQLFLESVTQQMLYTNIAADSSLTSYEAEVKKRLIARAFAGV